MSFKAIIFLLIFCLDVFLASDVSGILKSPIIIILLISPFTCVNICFMYFRALMLDAHSYKSYPLVGLILFHYAFILLSDTIIVLFFSLHEIYSIYFQSVFPSEVFCRQCTYMQTYFLPATFCVCMYSVDSPLSLESSFI